MIKYFKELDDRENQHLVLMEENRFKNSFINVRTLPLEFYQKYENLFLKLIDLDVLYNKLFDNNQTKKNLGDDLYEGYDFEDFYNRYLRGSDVSYYLTPEGKSRIDFLVKMFEYDHKYLEQYIEAIFSLFTLFSLRYSISNRNTWAVKEYLSLTMKVAKYQNKLSDNMEKLIQQALDEIEKYKFEISLGKYSTINLELPNCWYITPFKHLYNSMGPSGHKEANLIYPFYNTILRDHKNPSPLPYLKSIQRIRRDGFITFAEYNDYLNLKYDFSCVYPDFYYDQDYLYREVYKHTDKRSYNPKLVDLIIGIISAHAGIYDFFYRLRQFSSNYERDLRFIKGWYFDDILVKCCGFHKVTSLPDKIITTSLINYDDEFREYIKKGWKIDFIPPLVINEDSGTIEKYPEEFLTIRRILKY